MTVLYCPHCNQMIQAPEGVLAPGTEHACPGCTGYFRVPEPGQQFLERPQLRNSFADVEWPTPMVKLTALRDRNKSKKDTGVAKSSQWANLACVATAICWLICVACFSVQSLAATHEGVNSSILLGSAFEGLLTCVALAICLAAPLAFLSMCFGKDATVPLWCPYCPLVILIPVVGFWCESCGQISAEGSHFGRHLFADLYMAKDHQEQDTPHVTPVQKTRPF